VKALRERALWLGVLTSVTPFFDGQELGKSWDQFKKLMDASSDQRSKLDDMINPASGTPAQADWRLMWRHSIEDARSAGLVFDEGSSLLGPYGAALRLTEQKKHPLVGSAGLAPMKITVRFTCFRIRS
jgi:hypothetical protein